MDQKTQVSFMRSSDTRVGMFKLVNKLELIDNYLALQLIEKEFDSVRYFILNLSPKSDEREHGMDSIWGYLDDINTIKKNINSK